jgi:hypothetical protein
MVPFCRLIGHVALANKLAVATINRALRVFVRFNKFIGLVVVTND